MSSDAPPIRRSLFRHILIR